MNKTMVKFSLGILGIIIFGWGAFSGAQYYRYRSSPEYTAMKELEQLKEAYKNDSYGGASPEETLQLFLDALKNGDTDLAAKYFVIQKQEKWRNDLAIGKENGNLENFIKIYSRDYMGHELYPGHYTFSIFDNNRREEFRITLIYNELTGKWKIYEL